ncbi:hypothetical protein HPT29_018200 [Microvirga terrae]|uniref:EamA family transporter n=1 Tax=Microvirga terrae TaxID=2740529 RepID=A0ABY5RMJ9_9HYPH|nr:4-amino-4-deoxy-L-arabinose-phospho-UDP flippase [Microvirga terrae]UVF18420.1 hypothetical protein HPT29_018200 [Microvirga terrae]
MPPSIIISCILVSISLAGGQILFKLAALDIVKYKALGVASVFTPWLAAALMVYAFSTALWVWVLMHAPVSKAYPFVLLAVPLVPLASYWLFSEALNMKYAIGLGLIIFGLFLIQSD